MQVFKLKLSDLLEKEEIVVVRKEYRRKYKINWINFFKNLKNFVLFWTEEGKLFRKRTWAPPVIVPNYPEPGDIAHVKDSLVKSSVKDNMFDVYE